VRETHGGFTLWLNNRRFALQSCPANPYPPCLSCVGAAGGMGTERSDALPKILLGSIMIGGTTYDHDVVIDRGTIPRRASIGVRSWNGGLNSPGQAISEPCAGSSLRPASASSSCTTRAMRSRPTGSRAVSPPSANSLAKANDSWSSANSDDPSLNRRGRTKGNPLHPVGRKTTEPTANGSDGAESEARV